MKDRLSTVRANFLSLSVAVFVSLFFVISNTNVVIAEEEVMEKGKPEQVLVLKQHELKVVVPGDSVWRVARRFGVSIKSILGLNPEVAGRDEPGREQWLYKDMDTLKTPLLHSEMKNPEDIADSATVAISMGKVRENEVLIASMRKDLNSTTQALSGTNKQLTETSIKLSELSKKNAVLENRMSDLKFERDSLLWILPLVLVALVIFIMLFVRSREKLKDSRGTVTETTARLVKLEGDLNDARHKLDDFRALLIVLEKKTATPNKLVPTRTVVATNPIAKKAA